MRGRSPNCVLVDPAQRASTQERAEAYLDGWVAAVRTVLEGAAPNVLSNLVPVNLACANVLGLARSKTSDDFAKACLASRRLGKLVGDPVAAMRSLDSGRS